MSNQRKDKFVSGNFGILSFWEGRGENSSNPDLDQKVQSAQNSVSANWSSFRQT
jgi:hypothetical protein